MYEHRKHALISATAFAMRVMRHLLVALLIVLIALGAGVLGYHFVGKLSWIDSLLDASMILGGMGPVSTLHSPAAKIFASIYALFSGLAFIGVASLLILPFAHRILHRFHFDKD
jgi:hypothetical protein